MRIALGARSPPQVPAPQQPLAGRSAVYAIRAARPVYRLQGGDHRAAAGGAVHPRQLAQLVDKKSDRVGDVVSVDVLPRALPKALSDPAFDLAAHHHMLNSQDLADTVNRTGLVLRRGRHPRSIPAGRARRTSRK